MSFRMRKTLSSGIEYAWQVDLHVAGELHGWSRRAEALLAQEIAEMGEHFPHWLLVAGRHGRALRCQHCPEPLIFAEGAARCPACWRAATLPADTTLLWIGQLPTLVRNAPALERRLPALAEAGYPTIMAGEARYLLASLSVSYPDDWPQHEPAVRYASGFLPLLGIAETISGSTHMLGDRQACLYASGQWRGSSVRVVLQQRVVNHLASLIKIAAGVPPSQAFIGRIH